MKLHSSTRVPVDDVYVQKVGKAIYIFAYYEWTIIWIIEKLDQGFVNEVCREKVLTSGQIAIRFKKAIKSKNSQLVKVLSDELDECCALFEELVVKRNALVHAHPCSDTNGDQILNYQTKATKPLPDIKWPTNELENIIQEFDSAVCLASGLLDKLG
jgi:hypothetical protein